MIVRIVKMKFIPEKIHDFHEIFNQAKEFILGSEGCKHLELLQDKDRPEIFFTYSIWDSEEYLLKYRSSPLFDSVWGRTKLLFSEPPEAWTLEQH